MTIARISEGDVRMSYPPSAQSKGNVLVVEDDEDTGAVIKLLLQNEGYGVRLVHSRDDALLTLSRYIYDFVLLDYCMPGLSAEDFVTRIARRQLRTQIILLTAADKAPAIADRLKISEWIGKPFLPEQLVEKLDDLTGGSPIA